VDAGPGSVNFAPRPERPNPVGGVSSGGIGSESDSGGVTSPAIGEMTRTGGDHVPRPDGIGNYRILVKLIRAVDPGRCDGRCQHAWSTTHACPRARKPS